MWQHLLAAPERVAIFVADLEGQRIGFSCGGSSNDDDVTPNTGELWSLYLLREFWNRGIGRQLHDVLLEELERREFVQAILWVMESNERTRHWYERRAWTLDGSQRTIDVWGATIPEVRYRKRLGHQS